LTVRLAMVLYTLMTVDSASQHWRGDGDSSRIALQRRWRRCRARDKDA
jgi:hypothetical protein